jgi:hypothetical protein
VSYQFRQFAIPEHMMTGYIERGVPVGDFLTAVLENNLSEACGRADDDNLENLPAYVAYLYNEAPSPCHGSPEKVRAWSAHFAPKTTAVYDVDPQASAE